MNSSAEYIEITYPGKFRRVLDIFLIYILLFTSGSHIYNQSPNKFLIIAFVVVVFSWAFFSDRKINIKFILYASIFIALQLIIHLYTKGSLSISSVVGTAIKLIIAYFILKTVNERFNKTFVELVVFLATVSLFGYLTDRYMLLNGIIRHLPTVGNLGYEGVFYLYRFNEHIDRNNSIFFEPGAYQIFLNAAIFIIFFAKLSIGKIKRGIYISILLVSLITTFSTTGYLIFGLMLVLIITKRNYAISSRTKIIFIGLLSLSFIIFYSQFQSIIIDKINKYMAIQNVTDKQDFRSFDMLVDIEVFKKNYFGAGYDKYFKEVARIGKIKYGHKSSNGITSTLAIYGIPFSLFLFASYFLFCIKYFNGISFRMIPYGMLLIFLFSESYYVFSPVCLALVSAIFVYDVANKEKQNKAQNIETSYQ